MYPEIQQLINLATVGLVVVMVLAFGQLVLAWWRSRQDK